MYTTVRYDIPIDHYLIPAGTELEVITGWSEYSGFIAVQYGGGKYIINDLYCSKVPALMEA